eukprot:1140920-Pyramimonas_sp.AAC.1
MVPIAAAAIAITVAVPGPVPVAVSVPVAITVAAPVAGSLRGRHGRGAGSLSGHGGPSVRA